MGGGTSRFEETDWETANGSLVSAQETIDGFPPTSKYNVYHIHKTAGVINQREYDVTDEESNLLYSTRAIEGRLAWFDVLGPGIDQYLLRVQVDLSRRYWVIYRYGQPSYPGQFADALATSFMRQLHGDKQPCLYKKACITVSWSRYHAIVNLYGPPPDDYMVGQNARKEGNEEREGQDQHIEETPSWAVVSPEFLAKDSPKESIALSPRFGEARKQHSLIVGQAPQAIGNNEDGHTESKTIDDVSTTIPSESSTAVDETQIKNNEDRHSERKSIDDVSTTIHSESSTAGDETQIKNNEDDFVDSRLSDTITESAENPIIEVNRLSTHGAEKNLAVDGGPILTKNRLDSVDSLDSTATEPMKPIQDAPKVDAPFRDFSIQVEEIPEHLRNPNLGPKERHRKQHKHIKKFSKWVKENTTEIPVNPLEGYLELDKAILKCEEIISFLGQHQTMLVSDKEAKRLQQEELRTASELGADAHTPDANYKDGLLAPRGNEPITAPTTNAVSQKQKETEKPFLVMNKIGKWLKKVGDAGSEWAGPPKDKLDPSSEKDLRQASSKTGEESAEMDEDSTTSQMRSVSSQGSLDGLSVSSNKSGKQDYLEPLVGFWNWDNTMRVHKMKMHVAQGSDLALHVVLAIVTNQLRYERNVVVTTV